MKKYLLILFAIISLNNFAQSAAETTKEEIYTMVEEMPQYPGGQEAKTKFLQSNWIFPESAKKRGITGKCYLKFIIRPDGSITDIAVLKGVCNCPECDEEAIRVVSIMPKWIPGKQNGKTVSVYYNLPFNYQLQ